MHENGSGSGPERDGSLLRARAIDKSFGAVQALKGVDFEVRPGEVVALIGDNGAGKSTLINVITGVFPPDSGEIVFEGERVEFASPHDARERGLEAVYQDLAVAPQLDAVANIFLGRERRMRRILGRLGFLDQQRMRRETEEQLEELHVRIPDPTKPLSTFSGGQRQGVPVVFISHNMPQVFDVADRVVVLRLGEVVAELDPEKASTDEAVAAMTGSLREEESA